MLSRRMLLSLLAAGTAACERIPGNIPPAGVLPAKTDTPASTLVVVFQRFAADWINLLVPAGDSAYAVVRPNLKVTNPLPLDSYFGLHPSLADLKPIYDAGDMAFVTATGWIPLDSRDRSHFYAQTIAESGARSGVGDGWLGRVMQCDSQYNNGLWAALAAEASVPVSLQGFASAIALRDFAEYSHGSVMADAATSLLETMALAAGEPGATVLRLATSMRAIAASPPPVSPVTYPATNLGQGLKVAAQAIRGGLAPRVVTVTSDDDWDTHVTQASRHAASLPVFAAALRAFYEDLGPLLSSVTLVTMTEFGRKAVENVGGTDHGTASSMLVMGKRVAGRQVYGQWPGLNASALYQGEDLEPTTDFRAVLGELLVQQLGASEDSLEAIFPGGYAARGNWRNFTRAV
ncbi:MAG TPA: DUF1501 domain-containing protein [Solimonas sp.]|nr:DUF1501 domain-containing protein [Solimonas sp.]